MCLGLLCERCMAEYACGNITPTGRKLSSQPNTQELPAALNIGSKWIDRQNTRRVIQITRVTVGTSQRPGRVYYETFNGEGYYPATSFRERYKPAPITASECGTPKVKLDFSAIEQRVIAALEDCTQSCGSGGQDFHKLRAAEIFNVKPSDVTPLMRRVGKAANLIDAYSNKR